MRALGFLFFVGLGLASLMPPRPPRETIAWGLPISATLH